MRGTALGHRLETLNDGLNTFANGERIPLPLIATDIRVQVLAGAALVKTIRRFCNAEQVPIEAIMTFPVGFDAVVTGLAATIDGRRMVGVAQEKAEARETYETALDEGRMSVLHEEALRGIHIMSVGALPSGAEVLVELEQVVPLTEVSGKQFLRLPMTAGQLYGNSPLLPADDFVTAAAVRHEATLQVTAEAGQVYLDGTVLHQGEEVSILLNRSVEVVIEGGAFGLLTGRAADGRAVSLSFKPAYGHDASLDLHILVDRSGSTQSPVGRTEVSVWQAMRNGLRDVLRTLRPSDQISLWQFDSACQFLGTARGDASAKLTDNLQPPEGGTELTGAVRAAIAAGAKDLLVLTDGQTWAHIVEELKGEAVRISAILVGSGSLDANVGHLCALTGGQIFYAPDDDVSSPLKSALEALRTPGTATRGRIGETGPEHVVALRGGITIEANWTVDQNLNEPFSVDAVGCFAAALAIPILGAEATQAWARAHGLCTHSTSLILVDEVSQPTEGFSQMRKVPLMQVGGGAAAGKPTPEALARLRSAIADDYARSYNRSSAGYSAQRQIARKISFAPPPQFKRKLSSKKPSSYYETTTKHNHESTLTTQQNAEQYGKIARKIRSWIKGRDAISIIFSGFQWDRFGDALLSADFSSLNPEQAQIAHSIAEEIENLALQHSASLSHDALMIYALALIARKTDGRLAARFARRGLKGAPNWLVAHRA